MRSEGPLLGAPIIPFALDVIVLDAQQQARTPRDVKGPWMRPGRVPSRAAGRKGTRRAWKRSHPPDFVMRYREPDDVLIIGEQRIIATPRQYAAIQRMTESSNAF